MDRGNLIGHLRIAVAIEIAFVDGQWCPTGGSHWTPNLHVGGAPLVGDRHTKTSCTKTTEDMQFVRGTIDDGRCPECLTAYAAWRIHKVDQ